MQLQGLGRQQGAALLLAMVILGLVATVTAGMVWQQTGALQVEAAERARAQSAWILSGALDWARLILREDLRNNQARQRPYDSLDEPWATPLAEARLSTFLAAATDPNAEAGPEAFLSGSIVDAQSRWNLRGLIGTDGKVVPLQLAALRRLCEIAGAPTDSADRIAEALRAAWAPGTDENPRGAPLPPSRVQDLVWLGIDAATVARLRPFVELLPTRTAVNVNTAASEVLVAAIDGLDLGTAQRLVQARQRKAFVSIEEVHGMLGAVPPLDPARLAVTTNFFEITGRLRLDERVLEERSLVERRAGGRGSDVVTLRRERLASHAPPR